MVVPALDGELRLHRECEIRVTYGQCFAAKRDPDIARTIDTTWDAVRRDSSSSTVDYVDKPKFRLAAAESRADALKLYLGPAAYRDYIGYRTSTALRRLAHNKARELGHSESAFLPNVLGNVALIVTRDNRSLAILRSSNVATYRGFLDLPGGHPEPERVEAGVWDVTSPQERLEEHIRRELFASIVREVHEELGVELSALGQPRLLCVLQNCQNVMKPDMVFVIRTDLTSKEVASLSDRSGQQREISRVIVFDPLRAEDLRRTYPLTPVLEGALAVFRRCRAARDALDQ